MLGKKRSSMLQPSILIGIGILTGYLVSVAVLAGYKEDRSIANFAWGGGCALLALYTLLYWRTFSARQLIVTTLVVLWAVRIIGYLYIRYNRDDPRFIVWRQGGTQAFFTTLSYVFGIQLILLLIMFYPVGLVNTSVNPPLNRLDLLGVLVCIFGFIYESLSDYQLYYFMKTNRGTNEIMDTGLWRYCRHPNYFGEIIIWVGIFLIAFSLPGGRLALLTPVTIAIWLLFIAGIPWIEKAMDSNTNYRSYKERTSCFFPWIPGKK